jgi:hypothetical protein
MEDRSMKTAITILFAILTPALLVGCEKDRLDAQVKELCAKDGGVKVYETVRLPPDRFDQWGMVNFYRPTQGENALGSAYKYLYQRQYLRGGVASQPEDLTMVRTHILVFRISDNKLLGESVLYSRRGGDLPGPWHPSASACPEPSSAGDIPLLKAIFIPISRE